MRTFEGIQDIEVDAAMGILGTGNKAEEGEFTLESAPVMTSLDDTSRLEGESGSITGASNREFWGRMWGTITCCSTRRGRNHNIRVRVRP